MAFLNWVAYVKELSPDVQKDHLKCPMYNCRKEGFQHMESFLSHVSTCERLPEADYWCPYCCRQEHFGVSELQGGSFATRLKRAYDFFKRFGRRNHVVFENPPYPSNGSRGGLEGAPACLTKHGIYTIDEKPEMEAKSLYPSMKELDGTGLGTRGRRSIASSHDWKNNLSKVTPELHGSTQTMGPIEIGPPERRSYTIRRFGADTSSSSDLYKFVELPGSPPRLAAPVPSNPRSLILDRDISQNDSSISSISPTSVQYAGQYSPTVSPITSPVLGVHQAQQSGQIQSWSTTTQYSTNDVSTRSDEQHDKKTARRSINERKSVPGDRRAISLLNDGGVSPHYTSVNPWKLASVKTGEAVVQDGNSRATCWRGSSTLRVDKVKEGTIQVEANMHESRVASTQAHVESLYQLVCMFNDRWRGYLDEWPDLYDLSAGLNTPSPFDDGLQGLQLCLEGRLPTTLRDVFSFVHLGYACAYMCHCDNTSYAWDVFYQNVLQWGEAISDKQDRYRFSKIAELLWLAPGTPFGSTAAMLPADPDLAERLIHFKSTFPSMLGIHGRHTLAFQQQDATSAGNCARTSDLQSTLRDGVVVGCCTRFLDGRLFPSWIQSCADSNFRIARFCIRKHRREDKQQSRRDGYSSCGHRAIDMVNEKNRTTTTAPRS